MSDFGSAGRFGEGRVREFVRGKGFSEGFGDAASAETGGDGLMAAKIRQGQWNAGGKTLKCVNARKARRGAWTIPSRPNKGRGISGRGSTSRMKDFQLHRLLLRREIMARLEMFHASLPVLRRSTPEFKNLTWAMLGFSATGKTVMGLPAT